MPAITRQTVADAAGILNVGRDLGRTFRERPAIVVGVGVLGLIGITVLSRSGGGGDEEPAAEGDPLVGDPLAGLGTSMGSSTGFGYPSAGDGSYSEPPDLGGPGFDLPFGLSCNGEPKPTIAGLPGTWDCTDAGWVYVPPVGAAPAPVTPPGVTPPPTARKYRLKVNARATVKLANVRADGKISSWTDRRAGAKTIVYPSGGPITRKGAKSGKTYRLAKPTSGPYAGREVQYSPIAGVSLS
jgi:hypothetical protein